MELLLSLVLAITIAPPPGAEVAVKIPPGIGVREQELRSGLPSVVKTRGGYDRIEIIIYHFSQGIEKFSYSEGNAMKETQTKGDIQALVKLKSGKVLRRALFIGATGASREQILHNFIRIAQETLSRY